MPTDLRLHDAEILRPLEELSKAERVKAASRQLRGSLADELGNEDPEFSGPAETVLKFHGVYQQEDRDLRKRVRHAGIEALTDDDKLHIMMSRTRVPGGVLSADGYLAHDEVATRWGNQTIRLTTRQAIQLHGVVKSDLKATLRAINETLLTTLGGCGDHERNIMCCPLPVADAFHGAVNEVVAALVRGLAPTSTAYTEIWLDGLRVAGDEPAVDDLYGPTYLPRKFKTCVAPEGDNCVDVYSHDLAFVAHRAPGGGVAGFTVLAGGGLGRTHRKPETFPALAVPFAFATADQVVAVARAVVGVQRDFGNRRDRRHARLKYLISDRGIDWFRARVQERLGFTLEDPRTLRWDPLEDHLGWHDSGDGRLALGLFILNGRIADTPELALRSTLRRIVDELRPGLVLTPQQNLLLTGIHPRDRGRVEELLAIHAVRPLRAIPMVVRESLACPALPTCGQAVAEAERVAPELLARIGAVVTHLGLEAERFSIRMTGCPNGCARPYLGDVGIVGTTLGKYDLHLGGDREGTRLNAVYAENITLDSVPGILRGPLTLYAAERAPGEGFGDFCHRLGLPAVRDRVAALAPVTAAAPAVVAVGVGADLRFAPPGTAAAQSAGNAAGNGSRPTATTATDVGTTVAGAEPSHPLALPALT